MVLDSVLKSIRKNLTPQPPSRSGKGEKINSHPENLPMLSALLLGTGLLLASLLSFAVAIALVVSLMSRVIKTGYSGESFWKTVAIMIVITSSLPSSWPPRTCWRLPCGLPPFTRAARFQPSRRPSISLGRITRLSATGHRPIRPLASARPAGGHQRPVAVRSVNGSHVRCLESAGCGLPPLLIAPAAK